MMGANGENMDRKWPKEIHAPELTIDALLLHLAL